MTSAASSAEQNPVADTRNLHWRQNNKGSALLQKLGWKEGQALGSKARPPPSSNGVASGEGLKVVKRQEGLGLGAGPQVQAAEATSHDSFAAVLETLKKEHPAGGDSQRSSSKNKKKRKASSHDDGDNNDADNKKSNQIKAEKKETIFASNRITNGRVRDSKFASKSASDMACIFGKDFSSGEIADQTFKNIEAERKRKKDSSRAKREKEEKKKNETMNNEEEETKKRNEEKARRKKQKTQRAAG